MITMEELAEVQKRAEFAEGKLAEIHAFFGKRPSHGAKGDAFCIEEHIAALRENVRETTAENVRLDKEVDALRQAGVEEQTVALQRELDLYKVEAAFGVEGEEQAWEVELYLREGLPTSRGYGESFAEAVANAKDMFAEVQRAPVAEATLQTVTHDRDKWKARALDAERGRDQGWVARAHQAEASLRDAEEDAEERIKRLEAQR